MRTKIISAFPGTGKSYFTNKYPEKCADSDSSKFSWTPFAEHPDRQRNPQFPNNYIEHIKNLIGKVDYIFVSSHKEVRQALLDNCIFFYLFYPSATQKQEYIERYKTRGNNEAFIDLVNKNWVSWIVELSFETEGCKNIQMKYSNLEEELENLKEIKNV